MPVDTSLLDPGCADDSATHHLDITLTRSPPRFLSSGKHPQTEMALSVFLDDPAETDVGLLVANRRAPDPIQRMLTDLFADQPVAIDEVEDPDMADDTVLLLRDGAVVATSPLAAIQDAILFVNSDLFITGTRELGEIDLPDVLAGLEDVSFRLRGYPESHKEKLLLILVSRAIEQRALAADGGILRSSFQRLGRIHDEVGTRQAYDRLDRSNVDVLPGWLPPPTSSITAHVGFADELAASWFVVYDPAETDADPIALLAIEQATNEWAGTWTSDPETVFAINRTIERRL